MHIIEYDGYIGYPEQGMIIGNGDFCVSVYQNGDELIMRMGKGDIWDRRLDLSVNPEPTHIQELAHGLEIEGWTCPPYGGDVYAANGTDNPERMKEICQPTPSNRKPFPMPKPAGELALRLPSDFRDLHVSYRLEIEDNILQIKCTWPSQAVMDVVVFVHPDEDILCVRYEFELTHKFSSLSDSDLCAGFPGVYFQLRRHADLKYADFAVMNNLDPDFPAVTDYENEKALPPPEVIGKVIVQKFYPEPTFPTGFEYSLIPESPDCEIASLCLISDTAARINIVPLSKFKGSCLVKIKTSLSEHEPCAGNFDVMLEQTRNAGRIFWQKSSVELPDTLDLENLWYENLHLQRSIYGKGKVPPGLMFPCTIGDYSRWHGDYHSNYNFQSPFWGVATANHPELLSSYFAGAEFFYEPGKRLAEKYYGCRGTFIQLCAFPVKVEDDYLGCCPMGRMVYMTGWIWRFYYDYYTHTQDVDFLRNRAYPVIRDCALFFSDFMQLGDDGCYHIFPSNCGEDGFNGNPDYYKDRRENLLHAEYTIMTAIKCAEILGCDQIEIENWRELIAHWPEISSHDDGWKNIYHENHPLNPPEFKMPRWIDTAHSSPKKILFAPGHEFWTWYFGHAPMMYMAALHNGLFIPRRDFENFRQLIRRWREPNGTITAMSSDRYGRLGAWTESLGIIGPLQEMLIQSWRGEIELFPAWPLELDAEFNNLLTEGGFLVSATLRNGKIKKLIVTVQANKRLRINFQGMTLCDIEAESGDTLNILDKF